MKVLSGHQLIDRFDIHHLKEASAFGALSEAAIRYLLEKGTVRQLEKEDKLFTLDDPVNSFYVILQGKITLFKPGNKGNTHIMDFFFGQDLGYVAMIALRDRSATAIATEDSIALEVPCSLFYQLRETFPADFELLLVNLSRDMARRIWKTQACL